MGYFSRYDTEIQEHREPAISPVVEAMTARLDYLWERLEELLHQSEDPELFDRYFHRDHITQAYELPDTVQGALDAIAQVTRRLEEHRGQVLLYKSWMEAVRTTGATPEGQLVMAGHVYPRHQLRMQAA